jgi:hypothetical protein
VSSRPSRRTRSAGEAGRAESFSEALKRRASASGGSGTATRPTDAAGLLDAMGGTRGLVESSLPGLVFAIAYPVTGQELKPSLIAALVTAAIAAVVGLAQRRGLQQVIGGLVGIAIMAFVAQRTGRAANFYLPSVIKNGAYALAYLVSILVRWPLVGLVIGGLFGDGVAWRQDPSKLKRYQIVSWIWVAMFGLRVAIQLPLYLAGSVTALGFINVVIGLPLFIATVWASWVLLKPIVAAHEDEPAGVDGPDPTADITRDTLTGSGGPVPDPDADGLGLRHRG